MQILNNRANAHSQLGLLTNYVVWETVTPKYCEIYRMSLNIPKCALTYNNSYLKLALL